MENSKQDTLKKIINVSKDIRNKYKSLKRGQIESEHELAETFKPITEPLKELVKKEQIKLELPDNTPVKQSPRKRSHEDTFYSAFTPARSSKKHKVSRTPFQTPRTTPFVLDSEIIAETDGEESPLKIIQESLEKSDETREKLNDLLGTIAAEYFKFYLTSNDRDKDTVYGIRRISNGDWMMGNSKVEIDNNDLMINDKWYEGTRGLYELLFKKNYENYTEEDQKNYIDIVLSTSAHRHGYNELNRLNNNRSKKYREIIKPAIEAGGRSGKRRSYSLTDTATGYGILPKYMSVTPNRREYIYWDNPNELVQRLELLIASKEAGHTGHDNEILSIIEELREANIIE